MQHKSIWAQTGRSTYITQMTMQSQGGMTNKTKSNYCPPPIWKQNKPSSTPIWGCGNWDENKPSSCHHSAPQWAFLSLFRWVFRLFIMIPVTWWLSRHRLPNIHEEINKTPELQEVFVSAQFAELLSLKRPPILRQPPTAYFTGKQCFLLSEVSEVHWQPKTSVLSPSHLHDCLPYTFSSHKVTSTLLLDYNVPWRLK